MSWDEEDADDKTVRTHSRKGLLQAFENVATRGRDQLELGQELGRGGMATVTEAWQPTLRRVVAVKHTRETSPDEDRDALIQEAWVTSALGHPNIPPIHDIVVRNGDPHVIMKKIDGVPWSKLINRPEVIEARFQTVDPLGWNLQILMTVCNAVEYAHSKGILHLDLKPANVMIGSYGEVWVVDWGVAACTRADADSHLPLASEISAAFGTPAYMAPEMVSFDRPLGPATDVYLLGGILFRALTGQSPHRGSSFAAMVASATRNPVQVDPALPMADLVQRSLALDPAERPPTVAAFRDGLQAFLDRRGAFDLTQRASQQLLQLIGLLGDGTDVQRALVYDLYGAVRFGFEEALRADPASTAAAEGRRQVVELMARFELDAGDDRAAELLIDLLDPPDQELLARCAEVRQGRVHARARLADLERDNDPRTAWQARAVVTTWIGFVYVITPAVSILAGLEQGYGREMGIAGGTLFLSVVMMLLLAPWLRRSRMSRVLILAIALAPSLVLLMHVGCWLAGMPSTLAGTIELFVYFMVAVFATMLAEWRLLPTAVGYLVAYLVAMAWEGTTLYCMNVANIVLFVNMALVWVPAGWRNEMPSDVPLI